MQLHPQALNLYYHREWHLAPRVLLGGGEQCQNSAPQRYNTMPWSELHSKLVTWTQNTSGPCYNHPSPSTMRESQIAALYYLGDFLLEPSMCPPGGPKSVCGMFNWTQASGTLEEPHASGKLSILCLSFLHCKVGRNDNSNTRTILRIQQGGHKGTIAWGYPATYQTPPQFSH